ncbi:hypothetical protein L596_014430 [Steinernema carpocapsae]|uniref:Uncharacterized protein n=1 Tax=Steinernema carpocapsae TaxID=34508 RepID=A0A4V6A2T5_STECR|nr:hypothetical protein L596_014430 [Steinernema carpocapsae]
MVPRKRLALMQATPPPELAGSNEPISSRTRSKMATPRRKPTEDQKPEKDVKPDLDITPKKAAKTVLDKMQLKKVTFAMDLTPRKAAKSVLNKKSPKTPEKNGHGRSHGLVVPKRGEADISLPHLKRHEVHALNNMRRNVYPMPNREVGRFLVDLLRTHNPQLLRKMLRVQKELDHYVILLMMISGFICHMARKN